MLSCDKNKDEPVLFNQMVFAGKTFELKTFFMFTFLMNDHLFAQLVFVDKELDKETITNMINGLPYDFSKTDGINHFQIIFFYVEDGFDSITEKKMCFETDKSNHGDMFLRMDDNKPNTQNFYNLENGSFCIKKIGKNYEVNFNCSAGNNEYVIGHYLGEMIPVELTRK
jgi:hypothetical protein